MEACAPSQAEDSSDAFALSVQRVLGTPEMRRPRFLPLALRGKKQSLEVLAPAANSPLREAELWACVVAMLSTIVGGGALSIPYAFKLCGVRGGLSLLAFCALASDFALYALCAASRRTGTATLAELAKAAQGPLLENAVIAALFVLCAFVAVAYTRLLRDLLALFLAPFFAVNGQLVDRALVCCAAFVLFPLSLYRELHRLRYAAFVSFGGALCVAALFAARAAPEASEFFSSANNAVSAVSDDDADDAGGFASVALVALPIMSMSYLCQFNVLSVHARLKRPTRIRLKSLLHTCIALAFAFYVVFGVSGMIVCRDVPDDVAQDALSCMAYSDDNSTDVLLACAGGAFAVALLLNTPALVIPLRDSLLLLATKASEASSPRRQHVVGERTSLVVADEEEGKSSLAESLRAPPGGRAPTWFEASAHFLLTAAIVVVVVLCAQRVPGVASVWAVAGSSVGLFVAYLLPCYLYLKVRGHKDDGPARLRKLLCAVLFLASLLLAIVCTYRNAKAILFPPPPATTSSSS